MAGFLKRIVPKRFRKQELVVPVVRMHGAIMAGGSQLRPALNLAGYAPLLDKAFGMKDAPVVAISLNSPGGSPVQSRMIYNRIRQLAEDGRRLVSGRWLAPRMVDAAQPGRQSDRGAVRPPLVGLGGIDRRGDGGTLRDEGGQRPRRYRHDRGSRRADPARHRDAADRRAD